MQQEYIGKKGVIYTRVSSALQLEKGNGLQSQESVCKERAKNNGVEIVAIFSDGGVSGKFSSRKGLDEMIYFLKEKNKFIRTVDLVICDDMDRLSRDVEGWIQIKRKIEIDGKAEIQTMKQKLSNTNEGLLLQNVTVALKQYERQNNAERVKNRQRGRMLDGYRVFMAPRGYEYQGKGKDKKLELTSDASVIKEALEIYAEGGFKNDTEMYYYINDKLPHISIKCAEKFLSHDRLLFYAGFINYPRYNIEMVKAQHEPLISLTTLENIENRKSRKVFYKKNTKEDIADKMLLRNYIVCPFCGRPYSGGPSLNKMKNYYYYYRCLNPSCFNNKSYNVDKVHEEFGEYLKKLEIKETTLKCFKIILEELYEKEKDFMIRSNGNIKAEVKELDLKIKKLVDLITDTDDPLIQAGYQSKLSELTLKKCTLLESANNHELYEKSSLKGLFEFTLPILKSPYKLWKSGDPKIMQLVPGVVIGGHFLYAENINFTTPQDVSIYADFNALKPQKSLSLEVRRVELRSKRHAYKILPL